MTVTNPLGRVRSQSAEPAISPLFALTGALAAVLTVTALSRHMLPADGVLPAVSILFFVMSAAVALIAWRRSIPARQFSYWDAAGVLTLLGVCVATAVEPEQMVRLMAGADRNP